MGKPRPKIVKVDGSTTKELMRGLVLLGDYRRQVEGEPMGLLTTLEVARGLGMVSEWWKALHEVGAVTVRRVKR